MISLMRDLLKQLIRTAPTSDKGEIETAQVLRQFLSPVGIDCEIDCWDDKHANFTARIAGTGSKPALLFAGHLDVVPQGQETWAFPAFEGIEQDGKILGRGATDMLGGIAAVAAAVAEIHRATGSLAGDLIFSGTAAEETTSAGVKRFVRDAESTIGPLAGIIVPEPTGMHIMRAHRGILWLKITTVGKTAHGSMPHLGINAIEKMVTLIQDLRKHRIDYPVHPLLGGCSMSINQIEGGQAPNIVPDQCSIRVDIRTLPGQAHNVVIQDIERLFEQLKRHDKDFDASISVVRSVPALETEADNPFLKQVCKAVGTDEVRAVGFTTDGPWLARLNAPVIILGPGDPAMCHKPNEYIAIDQLEQAKEAYKRIIREVLG